MRQLSSHLDKSNKLSKRIYLAYSVWMVTLVAVFFLVPSMASIAWTLIGLSGVGAMVAGVVRNRPVAWRGWLLVAAATLFFVIGDTVSALYATGFPSVGDVFYIPVPILFAVGMYIIIKRRSPAARDSGAVLDAMVFTLSLATIVWIYLVMPNAAANNTLLVKVVSIAYPLLDILAMTIVIRLLIIDSKSRTAQLMAVAGAGLIVTDVLYGILRFYNMWSQGSPILLGIALCYFCVGAAALHPAMKDLDQPLTKRPPVRARRLVLLASAALIAPALLLIETFRGNAAQVAPVVAVVSSALFILVSLRMYTLIREISLRSAEVTLEQQRSDLVFLASHQLRTPAAAVKSILSLLLDGYLGKLSAKQLTQLQQANLENDHELEIVDDILSVMQLDSQRMAPAVVKTDLAELVKSVAAGLQPAADARRQKVTIMADKDEMAEVDKDKIRVAVESLVTNAIKYTPENGNIELVVGGDADHVVLQVKDNGVGISADELPKLFKRFSRSKNATEINMAGAGLGLYIANSMVEMHHGAITVESELGKGSVFTLTLPRKYMQSSV